MTEAEGLMAIRVLATIPELPVAPEPVAALEAAGPLARPAPLSAPRRARASFPGVSIAALALVAATVWSLVAIREATRLGTDAENARIAAELADTNAPETTLR